MELSDLGEGNMIRIIAYMLVARDEPGGESCNCYLHDKQQTDNHLVLVTKTTVDNFPMPEDAEFSDYPRLTTEGKKKILGLNAAKLYGIDVPEEFRLPDEAGTPAAKEDAQLVSDTP